MRIRARLFAAFREASGHGELSIELPEGSVVRDAVDDLRGKFPRMAPTLAQALIAVNHEYVGPELQLRDGDELALIPPVSGGSAQNCASTLASVNASGA